MAILNANVEIDGAIFTYYEIKGMPVFNESKKFNQETQMDEGYIKVQFAVYGFVHKDYSIDWQTRKIKDIKYVTLDLKKSEVLNYTLKQIYGLVYQRLFELEGFENAEIEQF